MLLKDSIDKGTKYLENTITFKAWIKTEKVFSTYTMGLGGPATGQPTFKCFEHYVDKAGTDTISKHFTIFLGYTKFSNK